MYGFIPGLCSFDLYGPCASVTLSRLLLFYGKFQNTEAWAL